MMKLTPRNTKPSTARGEWRIEEPLAKHTAWRVGGPAARFYRPADAEDLCAFLGQLDAEEPLLWLGLGSNLLVADGGFAGTVLALSGRLSKLTQDGSNRLIAGAGVPSPSCARFACRHGLSGIEFLAGIPGTLGGALAMNAGAWGDTTWQRVTRVWTVDRAGQRHERLPSDFSVGYRQVAGPPGEWYLGAEFTLDAADPAAIRARIDALLAARQATQPTGRPTCGSVFRNPPGDFAGRLIEAAGLKGLRVGGAEVSAKHANFIVNTGGASAADIDRLIRRVQHEVRAASGVWLEPEVVRVGDFAAMASDV